MAEDKILVVSNGDETNIPSCMWRGSWSGPERHWEAVLLPGDDVFVQTALSSWLYDLYNIATGTGLNKINSVKVWAHCYRAGSFPINTHKVIIKTGGRIFEGPEFTPVDALSYEWHSHTWNDNPDTLVAWTWADIAALQIGISMQRAIAYVRCCEIYVIVDYTPILATTLAASNVLARSARLNGEVDDDGTEACEYRFRYKVEGGDYSYTTWAGSVVTDDPFFEDVADLAPNKYHYFSAQLRNSYGESAWGEELSFKTAIGYPIVTASAVTYIQKVQAIGNGNITDTGGTLCTKRGVCWNTGGAPTIADDHSESVGLYDVGAFNRLISGLIPETHYYVKAYAMNSVGYAYSDAVEFDTLAEVAPVFLPLLGSTRVDATGFMAQLNDEPIEDYSAVDKAANTIVGELLALQINATPITVGTIDYTDVMSIEIPDDTILGGIMRLQEILGGYVYVDNDKALQWRTVIGGSTGLQIRYSKNLKGIIRTQDYSDFANRLYVYGAGEGVGRVKLGVAAIEAKPEGNYDMAYKWYRPEYGNWNIQVYKEITRWGKIYAYPLHRISFGNWSSSICKQGGAIRCPSIYIPNGVTILEAHLKFTQATRDGDGTVCNARISGDLTDDAAVFSTLVDYDARYAAKTVAVVDWDAIPTQALGDEFESPDIKTVIQEIVNRPGWAYGNAMALFIEDHDGRSDPYRVIRTFWTSIELGMVSTLYIKFTPAGAQEYVEDVISQLLYGGIYSRLLINRAINSEDALLEWAMIKLQEMKDGYISYQVDMTNLDGAAGFDFEGLTLGTGVTIIDEDLGINDAAKVVKIRRNLLRPLETEIEIANKAQDVIDELGRDFRWRREFY